MGCVDQIQQTLKSEHPAKPFGAVADRGFETTPQLSFAQADLVGQCRHLNGPAVLATRRLPA